MFNIFCGGKKANKIQIDSVLKCEDRYFSVVQKKNNLFWIYFRMMRSEIANKEK